MKYKKENFYSWIKKRTTQSPPSSLDLKILSLARNEFRPVGKSFRWTLPINTIAASLIIFLAGSIYFQQQINNDNIVLNESLEMILNYDSIELMADASQLSEEDWRNIEGVQ